MLQRVGSADRSSFSVLGFGDHEHVVEQEDVPLVAQSGLFLLDVKHLLQPTVTDQATLGLGQSLKNV